ELSTNSNEYGALGRGGFISVDGSLNGGVLRLHWLERAEGEARAGRPDGGSGHRLIERALRSRGGELEIEWSDTGLNVHLRLPVGRK
ncbi:MAG TPA: histidine kinase, partial [Sphingomicrobium sp.]|nr:histidine kinase [Sphingomicrobium sp.]